MPWNPSHSTCDPHRVLRDLRRVPEILTSCMGPPDATGLPLLGPPQCHQTLSAGSRNPGTDRAWGAGGKGLSTHGCPALTALALTALSSEPPSLSPATSPSCSDHRRGHRKPSTLSPAPWERIHKRGGDRASGWGECTTGIPGGCSRWLCPHAELDRVHSTPVVAAGLGTIPIPVSGGEWGTRFGLEAGLLQQKGQDGDAALAGGDLWWLPALISPKARRGSASLASIGTETLVAPRGQSCAWHPAGTR